MMVFWDNPDECVLQTGNKAKNRIQPKNRGKLTWK